MNADKTPHQGRVLAVDVGRKRIGLAVSDEGRSMAFPLATVNVTSNAEALSRILEFIGEYRPGELVVGLPLNMDGTRGPQADLCARFAGHLAAQSGLPVNLFDERLTTAWAEKSLLEQNMRRARRRQVIDQAAAVLLLQGYLRQLRGEP